MLSFFKPLQIVQPEKKRALPTETPASSSVPNVSTLNPTKLRLKVKPPDDVSQPNPSPRLRRRSSRNSFANKEPVLELVTRSTRTRNSFFKEEADADVTFIGEIEANPSTASNAQSSFLSSGRRSPRQLLATTASPPPTPPGDPALLTGCIFVSSTPPSEDGSPLVAQLSKSLSKGTTLVAKNRWTISTPFDNVNVQPTNHASSCPKCGTPLESQSQQQPHSPVSPELVDDRPKSMAPVLAEERMDSDATGEPQPVVYSRLSRRRSLARRTSKRGVVKRKRTPEIVDLSDSSPDESSLIADNASPKRRRKSLKSDALINSEAAPPQKLHSFFRATHKAVVIAKSTTNTRKACNVAAHPWTSPFATIHVNAPMYEDSNVFSVRAKTAFDVPDYSCVSKLCDRLSSSSEAIQKYCVNLESLGELTFSQLGKVSLWSELYKDYQKLDQVNSTAVASLVDWLRGWYGVKTDLNDSDAQSSQESYYSDFEDGRMRNVDRIALVSGPSGSGKTTAVKIAARELGISVLEINQSMCRSSKKVKDTVSEAMKSHRVIGRRKSFSFGKSKNNHGEENSHQARTLIVFEEVDELHEDELGFWKMIRELVSTEDCLRPIVCTATNVTSTMETVFGPRERIEEVDCVHRLLLPYPLEEQTNILGLKHIELQKRSPRKVTGVLKAIAKREHIRPDKSSLEQFSNLIRPGDIRFAINALQFWIYPFKHPTIRISNHAANVVCSGVSGIGAAHALASFDAYGDDHSVLEGTYRGIVSQVLRSNSNNDPDTTHVQKDYDALTALADALESFVEADTLCEIGAMNSLDAGFLCEEDLLPDAYQLDLSIFSSSLAADIRAQSLIVLNSEIDQPLDADKVTKAAIEEIANQVTNSPKILDIYNPVLARCSVGTDTLPVLRTMAVGSRVVRDCTAVIAKKSEASTPVAPIFGLGRRTRSKTRGNHMHSLGLSEDATLSLERSCLVAKRIAKKLTGSLAGNDEPSE